MKKLKIGKGKTNDSRNFVKSLRGDWPFLVEFHQTTPVTSPETCKAFEFFLESFASHLLFFKQSFASLLQCFLELFASHLLFFKQSFASLLLALWINFCFTN